MAKIGEGDARWIVTDRPDGTNCGNWHWQEKDLSQSTHDDLKAKLKGLEICTDGPGGLTVTVKEVSDMSGDVCVAQRKGKIMCYFDIKFTMKYKSKLDGETGEGKMSAPEVDHDCFSDDFELNVTATDSKPASKAAEEWMRGDGRKQVRKIIRDYFEALFVQNNVGKFLSKVGPAGGSPVTPHSNASTNSNVAKPAAPTSSSPSSATKGNIAAAKPEKVAAPSQQKSLAWKLQWQCPVEELWMVLTDSGRASHYTRAPAKIDPRASGTFEYLGGLISGYFVDVVAHEKLAMQWRLSSWPSGAFSSVVIMLSREEPGVCRLEFAQSGIPEGEFERVRDGWLRNFWDPIKAVFGFNYEILE